MSLDFYKKFEDKYRGSRDLIKSRLKVYLPFIAPLKKIYSHESGELNAVDLGCGRGEWLEILGENGFLAEGVDTNQGMLEPCKNLGLKVHNADAISFLKQLPDECLVIISGFHIAEHIPFEALQSLVKESLRVLKPAGLFILETPNPENIVVGSKGFYMDPTHERPIPPDLLHFLPEYYGFYRSKVLRLQQADGIESSDSLSLLGVLEGVSPDYAVIGQKEASGNMLEGFDQIFNQQFGVDLPTLANKYDEIRNREMSNINSSIQHVLDVIVAQAESRAKEQEARAKEQEYKVRALENQINEVYSSTSWRITKPIRSLKSFHNFLILFFKYWVKNVLKFFSKWLVKYPAFLNKTLVLLKKYPKLYLHLRAYVINNNLIKAGQNSEFAASKRTYWHPISVLKKNPDTMTDSAKKKYDQLIDMIHKQIEK
jgi:O-antigen chain-terminating methyltransferase